MEPNYNSIHPKFKLNGTSYQLNELKEVAYDLVKEGKPYEKAIGDFLSYWLDNKPTLEVKTSGSTGASKNIILQKQQMVNSALATGEYFDLKPENIALLCLPADYIAGKMMLVRAMVLGMELDYVEPSSSPLTGLSRSYSFVAMVPLQLENSIAKIEMIKTLIIGGAAVSTKLKEKVQEKSTAVFETYGMTETITHVAVKRINTVAVRSRNHFNAIHNVTFSKDDRECLIVSASKVSDNQIITNDVVKLISKTEFEWLGRYDNVINSGGIKLFPERIETKLAPLLSNRFFVAGMADEKLGQKLVLVIEGKMDSEKLFKKLKENVSFELYEIPKLIYSLEKFMETETGKIRRKENLLLIKK